MYFAQIIYSAGEMRLDQHRLQNTSWTYLLSRYKDLLSGGHWKPRDCLARRKVAVIIPFRDRQRHLRAFLAHTLPILQRQLIEFRIFVVEQVNTRTHAHTHARAHTHTPENRSVHGTSLKRREDSNKKTLNLVTFE
jgi:hypothetical protein